MPYSSHDNCRQKVRTYRPNLLIKINLFYPKCIKIIYNNKLIPNTCLRENVGCLDSVATQRCCQKHFRCNTAVSYRKKKKKLIITTSRRIRCGGSREKSERANARQSVRLEQTTNVLSGRGDVYDHGT